MKRALGVVSLVGTIVIAAGLAWSTSRTGRFLTPNSVKETDLRADSVSTPKIQNAAIDSDKLGPESVTTGKIKDGAVDSAKVKDGAITASKLAAGAVDSDKLADNAVVGSKIAAGAIDSTKFAPGAVDASAIADGSIDSNKLADGSVIDSKVAPGISASKLAGQVPPDSVNLSTVTSALAGKRNAGEPIEPSAIDLSTVTSALNGKMDDGQAVLPEQVDLSTVTSALAGKLAAAAIDPQYVNLSTVTSALAGKMPLAAVDPSYVNLSTVTSALSSKRDAGAAIEPAAVDLSTVTSALAGKMTLGPISPEYVDLSTVTSALSGKLSAGVAIDPAIVDLSTVTTALGGKQPTGNYITALTGEVTATGPGSVAATIAAGAVDSTKLADNAVVTAKIAASAVDTGKLADDSVTASKVLNGSLPASKLAAGGTFPAIDGSALLNVPATVAPGSIDSTKLASPAVYSGNIAAGAVDTAKLAADAVIESKVLDSAITDRKLATGISASKLVGAVPAGSVDLSTVTSALAGKRNTGEAIEPAAIDLSTITSALAGKMALGAVSPAYIDLSTVSTALGGKVSKSGDYMDGALTVYSSMTVLRAGAGLRVSTSTNRTALIVDGDGDVGIGYASPAADLQIVGKGGPGYTFLMSTTPGGGFAASMYSDGIFKVHTLGVEAGGANIRGSILSDVGGLVVSTYTGLGASNSALYLRGDNARVGFSGYPFYTHLEAFGTEPGIGIIAGSTMPYGATNFRPAWMIDSYEDMRIGPSEHTNPYRSAAARLEVIGPPFGSSPLLWVSTSSNGSPYGVVPALYVRSNGNIGIGEYEPAQKLVVQTGTLDTHKVVFTNPGDGPRVGIGVTSPQATLDIKASNEAEYALLISSPSSSTKMFGVQRDGHMTAAGDDPTLGTCANATLDTLSSDSLMRVAFTGANSTCQINFAHTWESTPICQCTGRTGAGEGCQISAESSTSITLIPLGGGWDTGDGLNIFCMQFEAE